MQSKTKEGGKHHGGVKFRHFSRNAQNTSLAPRHPAASLLFPRLKSSPATANMPISSRLASRVLRKPTALSTSFSMHILPTNYTTYHGPRTTKIPPSHTGSVDSFTSQPGMAKINPAPHARSPTANRQPHGKQCELARNISHLTLTSHPHARVPLRRQLDPAEGQKRFFFSPGAERTTHAD